MRILGTLAAAAFTAWTLVVVGVLWLFLALATSGDRDATAAGVALLIAIGAGVVLGTLTMLVGLAPRRSRIAVAGLCTHIAFLAIVTLAYRIRDPGSVQVTIAAVTVGGFALWALTRPDSPVRASQ